MIGRSIRLAVPLMVFAFAIVVCYQLDYDDKECECTKNIEDLNSEAKCKQTRKCIEQSTKCNEVTKSRAKTFECEINSLLFSSCLLKSYNKMLREYNVAKEKATAEKNKEKCEKLEDPFFTNLLKQENCEIVFHAFQKYCEKPGADPTKADKKEILEIMKGMNGNKKAMESMKSSSLRQ